MARLNGNGTLDPTFGTGGMVSTDFGGGLDLASALMRQTDGKIVIGGYASLGQSFALARYGTDGSLDLTFGSGGKVTTSFGGSSAISGIALQPDGKIVAAGSAYTGGGYHGALARYNLNGSLDLGFGGNGKVTTSFGGSRDGFAAISGQPDGKLVAAGAASIDGKFYFALARYNPNGSLDSSFGTGGEVITDFVAHSEISDSAIQDDGKIVVVGSTFGDFAGIVGGDFALARYHGGP